MCKAPTAAGKTFVDIIFEYHLTGQSETTNKVTDTWVVKKIGAWLLTINNMDEKEMKKGLFNRSTINLLNEAFFAC